MEENGLKITLLPSIFVDNNGKFMLNKALNRSGKIAGVCYNKQGYQALENEEEEKTNKRIDRTINSGHHSVYDHVSISFNMQNIPKIMAMIINNEKQYTTSEKSARYTKVEKKGSFITDREIELYSKWLDIFKAKIEDKYGMILDSGKKEKLAQENARYLVTVFMPTQMIYTTSLRQINYIASALDKYKDSLDFSKEFDGRLFYQIEEFNKNLKEANVLDDRLMQNEKNRSISLFGNDIELNNDYFDDIYKTSYEGTFAQLAQAQRHRTINYQMERKENKTYFVPPIIEDDQALVDEWLNDINSVARVTPQGEKVKISEVGTYDNFILKCKERLCAEAQLEVNDQTKKTLTKYKEALENSNNRKLSEDIQKYTKGARCTFPDYKCSRDCNFSEAKTLKRKI